MNCWGKRMFGELMNEFPRFRIGGRYNRARFQAWLDWDWGDVDLGSCRSRGLCCCYTFIQLGNKDLRLTYRFTCSVFEGTVYPLIGKGVDGYSIWNRGRHILVLCKD